MALKNIAEWAEPKQASSACGSACGTEEKPAACGAEDAPAACGAEDAPAACGASDEK